MTKLFFLVLLMGGVHCIANARIPVELTHEAVKPDKMNVKTDKKHLECVNIATSKYDDCMELALELLKDNKIGTTTTKNALQEGKELHKGKCKKLYQEDLNKCKVFEKK